MEKNKKVKKIIEKLQEMYPEAGCSLEYRDPLQLLIATQLAAQCTDARVNLVTPELFKKYKGVEDFASANQEELEQDIKSTGFFRNKARNIINCCRTIISEYEGKVPGTLEELLKLPGVGRKTANLVLVDIFDIPGVVVDTHAKRLSKRLGLTKHEDPTKVEFDLMKVIPKEKWGSFCHQLVHHGRALCTSRNPKCGLCPLSEYCPYGQRFTDEKGKGVSS